MTASEFRKHLIREIDLYADEAIDVDGITDVAIDTVIAELRRGPCQHLPRADLELALADARFALRDRLEQETPGLVAMCDLRSALDVVEEVEAETLGEAIETA